MVPEACKSVENGYRDEFTCGSSCRHMYCSAYSGLWMIKIPILVFHSGISESISCFIDHSAAKYLILLIILVCVYIEEEVYSILFFGSMFNMLADELLCSLRFVRYGLKLLHSYVCSGSTSILYVL